ncbi:MAG: peptide deformylase [Patescibacteria group bacterium]
MKNNIQNIEKVLEFCPEIVYAGHPVLRTKASEVGLTQGIVIGNFLIKVLAKYREVTGVGRGLAAPQIGENSAVFVTYVNDVYKIYINPRILKSSKELCLYREGCLSCAPMCADVKRPKNITLEYTDEYGNFNIIEADGVFARLLQHEYDHIEGILNIDIAEQGSIEVMVDNPLEEKLRDVI